MGKSIDYSPEMFSFQPGLLLGTALYSFFVKIGSFGRCLPGTVSHIWPASELTNQVAAYFFALSHQAAQTPRGSLAPPSFHNSVALCKVVQTAQCAVCTGLSVWLYFSRQHYTWVNTYASSRIFSWDPCSVMLYQTKLKLCYSATYFIFKSWFWHLLRSNKVRLYKANVSFVRLFICDAIRIVQNRHLVHQMFGLVILPMKRILSVLWSVIITMKGRLNFRTGT